MSGSTNRTNEQARLSHGRSRHFLLITKPLLPEYNHLFVKPSIAPLQHADMLNFKLTYLSFNPVLRFLLT